MKPLEEMSLIELAREACARVCDREGAPYTAECYRNGKWDDAGLMPTTLRGVAIAFEALTIVAERDLAAAAPAGQLQ